MGLAHASDIESHNPILALKPLVADRPEEMPAIPTPTIPPSQEGGFVRVEEAAVTTMPRWALGERRALEVPPHGTPTAPDLVRDRVQRPALPMVAPDLLVGGHPLGPPGGGEGYCPCGWLRGRERHGGKGGDGGGVCGIVHGRRRTGMLGSDACQLRGVSSEHVGQHVREILQQMKPIRHLAGRGSPGARRFRVGPRAIPPEALDAGRRLPPLGDGGGLPIGEQGQRAPSCEVQQERAIGMTPSPGAIIHAAALGGDNRGAWGAADHPYAGVPADDEA